MAGSIWRAFRHVKGSASLLGKMRISHGQRRQRRQNLRTTFVGRVFFPSQEMCYATRYAKKVEKAPMVLENADCFASVNLRHIGCFRKWWYPQIIHFNRVFHYKPSILGYPYFRKHPYTNWYRLIMHLFKSNVLLRELSVFSLGVDSSRSVPDACFTIRQGQKAAFFFFFEKLCFTGS